MKAAGCAVASLGAALVASQLFREWPAPAVVIVGVGLVIVGFGLFTARQLPDDAPVRDELAERRALRELARLERDAREKGAPHD